MDLKTRAFVIAVIIVVGGGAFSMFLRYPPEISASGVNLESIPLSKDGWSATPIALEDNSEQILDINQYVFREYTDESGFSIWLFVGYFTSQRFGSGVHSPRNCLPGSGWEIVNSYYTRLPGDPDLTVNRMDISLGESRQLMYYWFMTRAGYLTSEFSLKGDLVKNALLGRPTDAAFIRINLSEKGYDPLLAEKKVAEFVGIFEKEIYSALPF